MLIPLGGVLLLGAGAVVVAWLDRNAIGARLAIDYLARRGVPASIHLTRLDVKGVEGSLTLGAPDHPTLAVPHFAAAFSPAPPFGAPRLGRVVLVQPRLALGYDGRRLDFGALQPLIDEMARQPRRGGAGPDIAVRQGELRLRTPYGLAVAEIDADFASGALRTGDLRLRPTDLSLPGGSVRDLAAHLRLRPLAPHRYAMVAQATAAAASGSAGAIRDVVIALRAEAPFDPAAESPLRGLLKARWTAEATAATVGGARFSGVQLDGGLSGTASGRPSAPAFTGRATTKGQAGGARLGVTSLADVTWEGRASQLELAADRRISARFEIGLGAGSGGASLDGRRIALTALRLSAAGSAQGGPKGPSVDATGALAARGGLGRAQAGAEARRLLPGAGVADVRDALAAALSEVAVTAPAISVQGDPRDWRVRLARPLLAQTVTGARLNVTGLGVEGRAGAAPVLRGDGAAVLAGGGFPSVRLAYAGAELGPRGGQAQVEGDVAGSAGPVRDGRLTFAARVDAGPTGTRVSLQHCATASLGAWRGAGATPLARGASVDVCPSPSAPLFAASEGVWRTAAQVKGLQVALPAAEVSLAASGVAVQAQGRGGRLDGQAIVTGAVVRDTATPVRFEPVVLDGPVRLADQRMSGQLDVALLQGARRLGRARLDDDMRTGAGGVTFDAPSLIFAVGGLQPANVLPGLAGLGRDVSGPAHVELAVAWGGSTVTSSARIGVDGVQARTAAGMASGVRTQLQLTSLAPLTSAPHQRLTAERVAAVLPLTDVSASYALGGDALALDAAEADVAGGRVWLSPMRVGLTPGAPLSGVVHLDKVQLGQVLDALNLAQAVSIQAEIAGSLPFDLGPHGLRIADGRFAAMAPGRISLHRRALSAVAAGDAGAPASSGMQDFAYQALEDLAFTELDARVASQPGGRLGVLFHIRGRHDPPVAKPARIGLFALLRGHAFDKPIPLPKGTEVNLTLDSSLNLDDLLAAYLRRPAAGSAQVQP